MTNYILKDKIILILGGGLFQIPLIKKAKCMGLKTVLTDMYPNPPGKIYADYFVQVDIKNFEKNLEVAKEYNVDAVVSDQTDIGVPTAAWISEQLKLKGIGYDTSLRFTDKYVMKSALDGKGIPIPKFSLAKSIGQACEIAENFGYPIIIKPPSNQSSRGVYCIHNADELKIFFSMTKKMSQDGLVLIEEYIDGKEYTVEGFTNKGVASTLAISDKEHFENNSCVASKLTYPPDTNDELYFKICSMNNKIVETLGLPFGITHAEFRVKNGIPYLIEVAARGGGTFISSEIIPAVSGIDVNELLLKQLFNIPVTIKYIKSDAANLEFLTFPKGNVESIQGIDQIKQLPYVKKFHLDFDLGDYLDKPEDDRSRHGFMIITGKTRKEVIDKSREVKNLIQVKIS